MILQDTLSEVVESCARELPEGWRVVIEIERHAGIVKVFTPGGNVISFPSSFETIANNLNDAWDFASRHRDKELVCGNLQSV